MKDDGFVSNSTIGGVDIAVADVLSSPPPAGQDGPATWHTLALQPDTYSAKPVGKAAAGAVPVAGSLQLRVRFVADPSPKLRLPALFAASGTVLVRAMAGKALTSVQSLGKQDPFVVVSIVPTTGEGDRCVARTKPATDAGSDAEWNQTLTVQS